MTADVGNLYLDGRKHRWLNDGRWHDLIMILDNATSVIYYAQPVRDLLRASSGAGIDANGSTVEKAGTWKPRKPKAAGAGQ